MKNIEYERNILSSNVKIIIDTSAIMEFEGLQRLVEDIEVPLLEMNKRIIVPRVVWMELMRHLNSSNKDKQSKASCAVDIICMHRNIFMIEDDYADQEEIMRAFADAELLSELTRNKAQYGQLLISNDKKLSKDAFDLNKQESCHGYHIDVCYISNAGALNKCECVCRENFSETVEHTMKEVVKIVKVPEIQKKESWIPKVGIPIVTFAAGAALGKYGTKIVQLIKAVA